MTCSLVIRDDDDDDDGIAATLVQNKICCASFYTSAPDFRALRRCDESGRGASGLSLTSSRSRNCFVDMS